MLRITKVCSFLMLGFLGFLGMLVFTGCGGGGGGAGGAGTSTNSEFTGEDLEGGTVSAVELDADNRATVDFGTVSDSTEYVLAIYSYNENGSSDAYQLGSSQDLSADLHPLQALVTNRGDVTEDFHEWLRNQENELDPALRIQPESPLKSLRAASDPAVGSTRSFKVLSSFSGSSSYATVTAKLVYKTNNFLAYLDQRNLSSLTDSDLADLLGTFDSFVEREREILGGNESDVDADGRFNILFTQQVNQLGGSSGGIVTGFFYSADLLDYSQSNKTEMIYSSIPDRDGNYGASISKEFMLSNILPGVLPHEYQHMISFNMHYFENNGSPETSAVNEGMAHLMEDIHSLDAGNYMTTTGIENPARIEGYLTSIDSLCVTCGASLYQRGGSYLLLRYLYEQAQKGNLSGATSGRNFLNRMINTPQTGVNNIVISALGGSPSSSLFRDLFGRFALAIFMSNTGLTTDNRLAFDGLNLRGSQNDNRGTILQGPSVNTIGSFPATNSIGGTSVSYVKLTGGEINDLGGKVAIQLSNGANAGVYLVQTGL